MSILSGLLNKEKRKRSHRLADQTGTSFIADDAFTDGAKLLGFDTIFGRSGLKNSVVGVGTYVGANCDLNECYIGSFCSIAENLSINFGTHPSQIFVSTSAVFYDTSARLPLGKSSTHFEERSLRDGFRVEIGNDVWIGKDVLLKEGIRVGDGAIIGMGAVVTKDVPPYAIIGGVPAKLIRYRFSPQQIEALLAIKWWDWPIEQITKRRDDFSNIDSFLEKYCHPGLPTE